MGSSARVQIGALGSVTPLISTMPEYEDSYSVADYTTEDVKLWLEKMYAKHDKKYSNIYEGEWETIGIDKDPTLYLKRLLLDTIRLNMKEEKTTKELASFLKFYRFVFCVPYEDVPLHIDDYHLKQLDLVAWRLEIGK